jgi:O-acetyl-ADP-ribose deacetylase
MKTQLRMIRGDITTVDAEAIVNSANNDLLLGGGVSGAIRRVAGPDVQEECHKIGTVPLGTAVVTTGGLLKAQWIIHAAVNPLGLWADAKSVRSAVRAALKRAEEKQVKRLAIPAVGTGAGALPVERCADILIEEVTKHCGTDQTTLEEVMFVLYDEKPFAIFEERFKQKVLGEPPSDFDKPPAPAEASPAIPAKAGPPPAPAAKPLPAAPPAKAAPPPAPVAKPTPLPAAPAPAASSVSAPAPAAPAPDSSPVASAEAAPPPAPTVSTDEKASPPSPEPA